MLCVVIRMIYNFTMKLPVCKCNSQLCNHLVAPLAFSFGSYFEELCKLTLMSAVTWHKKKKKTTFIKQEYSHVWFQEVSCRGHTTRFNYIFNLKKKKIELYALKAGWNIELVRESEKKKKKAERPSFKLSKVCVLCEFTRRNKQTKTRLWNHISCIPEVLWMDT